MDLQNGECELLMVNCVVQIDEDGIERYVGLTEAESVKYLCLSRANDAGGLGRSDAARYVTLQAKHETARQVNARGEKSLNPFQKP